MSAGQPQFEWLDAFERNLVNPDTFDFPGFDIVHQIKPGMLLKIAAEFHSSADWSGERFWVIVTSIEGAGLHSRITGTVDNDLVHTAFHGLRVGDEVVFGPRHILDFDFGME